MTLCQVRFVTFLYRKKMRCIDLIMTMTIKWWQAKILQNIYIQKHIQKKVSICAYLGCKGRIFPPDADCCVCGASVHLECAPKVSTGDTTAYCSTNCIRFDHDSSIDNSKIRKKREKLLSHRKSQLWSLARSVGAKISYRPPGEGVRDIPTPHYSEDLC